MLTSANIASTAYDAAAYQQLYRYADDLRALLQQHSSPKRNDDALAGKPCDLVTGLPKWDASASRGISIVARRQARVRSLLLVLNVHGLRRINITLGRDFGDDVLRLFAARLRDAIHADDLLARFESDEFVVVSSMTASEAEAAIMGILTPVVLKGHEISVGLSVGGVCLSDDETDLSVAFRKACIALDAASKHGVQRICLYSAVMEADYSREDMTIEADLGHAVEREELHLVYQPQIDTRAGGRLAGVEALLRWQHPILGNIPPSRFIPIAENNGALVSIGEWVLRQACMQLRAWKAGGLEHVSMAVNVSPGQLRNALFMSTLRSSLQESGIAPGSLELEITESEIMSSPDLMTDLLTQIRDLGVRIAIDDFGVGHSNLARLRDLPIDRLKIDQSLIRDIETDVKAQAVVSCVMSLGVALGVDVIAEGVECEGQLKQLSGYGCHFIQGFLFGRPVPPGDLNSETFRNMAIEPTVGIV